MTTTEKLNIIGVWERITDKLVQRKSLQPQFDINSKKQVQVHSPNSTPPPSRAPSSSAKPTTRQSTSENPYDWSNVLEKITELREKMSKNEIEFSQTYKEMISLDKIFMYYEIKHFNNQIDKTSQHTNMMAFFRWQITDKFFPDYLPLLHTIQKNIYDNIQKYNSLASSTKGHVRLKEIKNVPEYLKTNNTIINTLISDLIENILCGASNSLFFFSGKKKAAVQNIFDLYHFLCCSHFDTNHTPIFYIQILMILDIIQNLFKKTELGPIIPTGPPNLSNVKNVFFEFVNQILSILHQATDKAQFLNSIDQIIKTEKWWLFLYNFKSYDFTVTFVQFLQMINLTIQDFETYCTTFPYDEKHFLWKYLEVTPPPPPPPEPTPVEVPVLETIQDIIQALHSRLQLIIESCADNKDIQAQVAFIIDEINTILQQLVEKNPTVFPPDPLPTVPDKTDNNTEKDLEKTDKSTKPSSDIPPKPTSPKSLIVHLPASETKSDPIRGIVCEQPYLYSKLFIAFINHWQYQESFVTYNPPDAYPPLPKTPIDPYAYYHIPISQQLINQEIVRTQSSPIDLKKLLHAFETTWKYKASFLTYYPTKQTPKPPKEPMLFSSVYHIFKDKI